jgi:phage gp16-like protein
MTHEEKDARIVELERALDSIEIEHGLTSGGNLWRFWCQMAEEAVANDVAKDALIRELVAALGSARTWVEPKNRWHEDNALACRELIDAALAKAKAAGYEP